MILLYYLSSALLVWLSFKSFKSGITWLRFVQAEVARSSSVPDAFATIFVPCRGLDDGLEDNLRSVLSQEYPRYEVIFIVDDRSDPAVSVIQRLMTESTVPTKLVVAPMALHSSQKVENLREGVLHAADASRIFVFVDSDVSVSPFWLRSLAAAAEQSDVGAATSYRWFLTKAFSLGSELRSVWNASIASSLGPNHFSNFCWGGSMAMRRDVFERLNIREKWAGTLSDDFTVTTALQEAAKPIVFIPQAMPVSTGECTIRSMLEFTTRQMKITRVYGTKLWLMSLIGSALFNLVMIASVLLAILHPGFEPRVSAVTIILLVSLFSVGKAWIRMSALNLILKGHERNLKRQFLYQVTLWALSPAIFLYNSVAALLSRRLTWRGTVYELKSASETVIISPNART